MEKLGKAGVSVVKPTGMAFISGYSSIETPTAWIADSGATDHVTNFKDYFVSYEKFASVKYVRIGNQELLPAHGKGVIVVETCIDGEWYKNHLVDVWYVPGMARNLFSIASITEKGFEFVANERGCEIRKDGKVAVIGKKLACRLYELCMRVVIPEVPAEVYLVDTTDTLQLWHERLGHQNKRYVKKFLELRGIKVDSDSEFCEGCMFGKQHRLSFGVRDRRAIKPGDLIHADVCGPMQEKSVGGMRYFVDFKDDFSRYRSVFFVKEKSEVVTKFNHFLAGVKVAGHTVKELLTDGGKEFDNAEFRKVIQVNGISHRMSMPYTPEQNGTAERENRTLVECARSMIHAKGLPVRLWAEAVNSAAYILNRTGPTLIEDKSPFEIWFGRKVCVDHLKIFGTECFVHVPKQKRQKWDKKGQKGILVGYCHDKDGYRIWMPEKNDVMLSRDIIFKDEQVIKSTVEISVSRDCDELQEEIVESGMDQSLGRQLRDRSKIRRPSRFDAYAMVTEGGDVASYDEAMKSEDAEHWRKAMNEEIESLMENATWILVDKPEGRKIIDNRWVLRLKLNPDGSIARFKARLVAKGYSQKPGIDYDETFSPVARFDTIRTVLSVAASEGLKLAQFDVKTAFLYAELDEEIYMKQPDGYSDGTDKVCRLTKSLYGLKQAPRCWNKCFVEFLASHGLKVSSADPCLFVRVTEDRKMLVALYVDDGLMAGSNVEDINVFLQKMEAAFKITIGQAQCFLGVQIMQEENGSIFLCQEGYARKVLKKFCMVDANKVTTPIERVNQATEEEVRGVDEKVPYREAMGSLMYLAVATRPDLAYAVSVVSSALDSPTNADWQNVKRIFKYLTGTSRYGIYYQAGCLTGVLEAYSDADYAGDQKTRRSTSGVVCKYSGGAITWLSKKQSSVAMSTTESEFIAASEAAKEVIWLKRLLGEVTKLQEMPILRIDNASAIKLAKNPEFHKRSKHIEVRHYFVREKWQEGLFGIEHVESESQVADIMTKPLVKARFQKIRGC